VQDDVVLGDEVARLVIGLDGLRVVLELLAPDVADLLEQREARLRVFDDVEDLLLEVDDLLVVLLVVVEGDDRFERFSQSLSSKCAPASPKSAPRSCGLS
jgi:hypothetical protein